MFNVNNNNSMNYSSIKIGNVYFAAIIIEKSIKIYYYYYLKFFSLLTISIKSD